MKRCLTNGKIIMTFALQELEFHRKQPTTCNGDRFVPVMKEFITTATYNFGELEDSFLDMKLRV